MQKVLLAMSGGVDSAVCAQLLREQGFKVIGVHFIFFGQADPRIASLSQKLDIEIKILDAKKEFQDSVVQNFFQEYQNGRTPSPCCLCNPTLKFPLLERLADQLSIHHIATGHYVQALDHQLFRSPNRAKDQSYFLYRLPVQTLDRCIFPLGEVTDKSKIIELSQALGLQEIIDAAPESQDFCFLEGQTLEEILRKNLPAECFTEGDIVDTDGNFLKKHSGLPLYTIGQRKGLDIGGTGPWYVVAKDAQKNQVTVGKPEDLISHEVRANQLFFRTDIDENKTYLAQIRYGQTSHPCHLKKENDTIIASFDAGIASVSPGQSLVIYDDQLCLGGGIII